MAWDCSGWKNERENGVVAWFYRRSLLRGQSPTATNERLEMRTPTSEASRGPEIPGMFYIGNSGQSVNEADAIESYNESLPKIPREAFTAVANRPYGFAVYCENQYSVYAEAWVNSIHMMLAALMAAASRDDAFFGA